MKSKPTETTQGVESTRTGVVGTVPCACPVSTQQVTIQRIEAQLEQIEGLTEQLLTGIDLPALPTKERLTLVIRLLALSQRAIAMRQANLIEEPENEEADMIEQFMSYMRGEISEDTNG